MLNSFVLGQVTRSFELLLQISIEEQAENASYWFYEPTSKAALEIPVRLDIA